MLQTIGIVPCEYGSLSALKPGDQVFLRGSPADTLEEFAFVLNQRGTKLMGLIVDVDGVDEIAKQDLANRLPAITTQRVDVRLKNPLTIHEAISAGILLSGKNIRLQCPLKTESDVSAIKTLSSLGVMTLTDIRSMPDDPGVLPDLMAWALLNRARHASCDPFTEIAAAILDNKRRLLAESFREDFETCVWVDGSGRLAISESDIARGPRLTERSLNSANSDPGIHARTDERYDMLWREGPCGDCQGFFFCGGYLRDSSVPIDVCGRFAHDFLETVQALSALGGLRC